MRRIGSRTCFGLAGNEPLPNVWILNQYAATPDDCGGTRHFELAKRLARRGYDVTIIGAGPPGREATSTKAGAALIETRTYDGVRFVLLRLRTAYARNGIARALNMTEFALAAWACGRTRFRGAAPNPDIVIGSTPHLLAPAAAWRLANRFRARFVIEVRDLWPETIVQMGLLSRGHPIARLLYRIERFLYARASSILTVLPHASEYFDRVSPGKPVLVLPNGVDLQAFDCSARDPGSGDTFRVVYAGTIRPANGLLNVVLAADLLKEDQQISIHVYGDGACRAELEEQVELRGLSNLVFHGPVPKANVPSVLCSAHAFLLNYARIGIGKFGISPNKLWEYMAAGRPVIFAHEAANDPVADVACGLSLPPEAPDRLADAIRSLAAVSPEERRAMGKRGRVYVRQHHDWDLLAGRLAKALDEVISAREPL